MLRFTLPLLLLGIAALAAGCGSGPREEVGGDISPDAHGSVTSADIGTPAARTQEVVTGGVRWATRLADNVRSLMGGPGVDVVMAARVLRVALPYDPRPGYLGWTPGATPCSSPSPEHPKCSWTPSPEEWSRPPGREYTIYEAEVLSATGSDAPAVGDHVYIRSSGGIWEDVAYHYEGDALLNIGQTYLLAAGRFDSVAKEAVAAGRGYIAGGGFTSFVVGSDGRLQPADPMWADLPAVKELSGRTVDEAKAIIESARDAAPPTPASQ